MKWKLHQDTLHSVNGHLTFVHVGCFPFRLFADLCSVFLYFYSIIKCADGIARLLDANAKQKTWLRSWLRQRKIEALSVDIFWIKQFPPVSPETEKFLLAEGYQKPHQLTNGWSQLHAGTFTTCSSWLSLTLAMICNGAIVSSFFHKALGAKDIQFSIQNFRLKVKWNSNFPENLFGNCRLPPEVVLFFHSEWNRRNFLAIC